MSFSTIFKYKYDKITLIKTMPLYLLYLASNIYIAVICYNKDMDHFMEDDTMYFILISTFICVMVGGSSVVL